MIMTEEWKILWVLKKERKKERKKEIAYEVRKKESNDKKYKVSK